MSQILSVSPTPFFVFLVASRETRERKQLMTGPGETNTDESDLRVVCKIIEAAIWYTVEERVDLEGLIPPQQAS